MKGQKPVIVAERLSKTFGDNQAVRDLSFAVPPGAILGLLGPNGAGKTTTINMLTTLLVPDDGVASIAGYDVAAQPDQVRQVIGLAGQAAAVDDLLTARQNLETFGRLYKIPAPQLAVRIDALIERFDMASFADRPAGTYSGGERRRLDLIASLIADPPAMFLDEPTAGLDPRTRIELWEEIEAIAARGTAVVLTTQYLEEADRLADEIIIIDRGTTVAAGAAATLKADLERDVLEVHVGTDADLDAACRSLDGFAGVSLDERRNLVSVPMRNGSETGLDVLRRLDGDGVALLDFQLRRPTLDDVFLALTGRDDRPETGGGSR